jgi:2-polyprenyl-6-methoxyphenol hydroxylase-like FAD-dependent oxidoreductase
VWEGFGVSAFAGGRVDGAFRGGGTRSAEAVMVVGADGKHSTVARAVGAREYHTRPATSGAFYTYVDGLGLRGGELYLRPDRLAAAWPTSGGLAVVYLAVPRDHFAAVRERGFAGSLAGLGDLGERVAAGRIAERVRGTVDLPNTFRVPYGPGWALAGDAGLVMDPITGQGIGNALRDADGLAAALVSGLGGGSSLRRALGRWHRARDRERRGMYRMTTALAAFGPDRLGPALFPAIAADPAEATRFLGVLAGVEPAARYFAPANLLRLVGARGLTRLALDRTHALTAKVRQISSGVLPPGRRT